MTAYRGIRVKWSMSLGERLEFYSRPSESGCCEWVASTDGKFGYGKLSWNGRMQYAHRLAWEVANGRPIPCGSVVMHSCDNPPCVNPEHLSLGTQAENVADCSAKSRRQRTHGQLHVQARFTDDQADEIRRRSAAGTTNAELAREHDVSETTIWRIVNNRSYNQPRRTA